MTIRELEKHEWRRLDGHPIFESTGVPNPDFTKVLIAEAENGELVGIWSMVQVIHCEPIWIADSHRNGLLASRMWAKMKVLLDHFHINMAYCFSDTPKIADYLSRLGLQELPYRTFLFKKGQK